MWLSKFHIELNMYKHLDIEYIYMCVCVCVCETDINEFIHHKNKNDIKVHLETICGWIRRQ